MKVATLFLDPSGGRKDHNGLAVVTMAPGGPRVAHALLAFQASGRKTRRAYMRALADVLADFPDHAVVAGVEANGVGLHMTESLFEEISREMRPGGSLAADAHRIALFALVIAPGSQATPQRVPDSPGYMYSISRHAAVNGLIHRINTGAAYPAHADGLVLTELDDDAKALYAAQAAGWEARGDRVDHAVSVARGGPGDDALFALLGAQVAADWGARRGVRVRGPLSAGLLVPARGVAGLLAERDRRESRGMPVPRPRGMVRSPDIFRP